jgi:hypothetical protein
LPKPFKWVMGCFDLLIVSYDVHDKMLNKPRFLCHQKKGGQYNTSIPLMNPLY